jgi:hypothetical protein
LKISVSSSSIVNGMGGVVVTPARRHPPRPLNDEFVQIDLILQLSDVAAGRQLIEPCPAEPDWSIAS